MFPSIVALLPLLFVATATAHTENEGFFDSNAIEIDESRHDIDFFTFVTRPDLDAPRWEIEVYNESAVAPGYWFVAPYGIVEQVRNDNAYVAPHIYDSNGELIWSGAKMFRRFNTFDFKTSQVQGEQMLTLLYPHERQGLIIDHTYSPRSAISLGVPGFGPNMHEFQIVDDGTRALYLTHHTSNTVENSERVGYKNGTCRLAYQRIEERDVKTGELTFEWSSGEHIPEEESALFEKDPSELCSDKTHMGPDYLHLNSVEKLPDGDYLISSRHTDTIYKVSAKKRKIVWRLGGKKNDFKLAKDTHWSGQHDVRCLSQNGSQLTLTVFDNAYRPGWPHSTNPFSRGLVLSVDTDAMTAQTLMTYPHPHKGAALERGSFQTLPNGNALLFWTNDTLNSEYSPEGQLLKTARLPSGLKTYRGYKYNWIGKPAEPPTVHSEVKVVDGSIATVVHVSWNGATEVAAWNLYRTDREQKIRSLLLHTKKTGFETQMVFPNYARFVMMEAIDIHGKVLGESLRFRSIEPDLDTLPTALRRQWREMRDTPWSGEAVPHIPVMHQESSFPEHNSEHSSYHGSTPGSAAPAPAAKTTYPPTSHTFENLMAIAVFIAAAIYAPRITKFLRNRLQRQNRWKYNALNTGDQMEERA